MYNVKVKYFVDGSFQIQLFKTAILSSDDKDFRRIDRSTGEIINGLKPEYVPFYDSQITYCREKRDVPPEEYVARSLRRTVNQIYDYARSNLFEWFITFTFDEKLVNRYDYSEVSNKLSKWLNNSKRSCPDVKYLVVPEQHKDGAWHFHGLFANCDALNFVDSGKLDKSGNHIYNVGRYKFGFTTATRIKDMKRTASYICKYITKELCLDTKGRKRYWVSKNVQKPFTLYEYSSIPYACKIWKLKKNSPYVKSVNSVYNDVTYIEK